VAALQLRALVWRQRHDSGRTSVFARLTSVIISNSCHASIGSPIWRKPAAALRWIRSVVGSFIGHDQIIGTPDEGKLENLAGGEP